MTLLISDRLTQQHGVVAVWQLRRDGHRTSSIRHALRGMRMLHPGVYLSGHAPPTDHQRWLAATLAVPGNALSHASRGQMRGFYLPYRPPKHISVTRAGNGGPRLEGSVLAHRSQHVDVDLQIDNGIRVLSNPRTVLDLIPTLGDAASARLVRDALRLRAVSNADLRMILARHRGRRGARRLRELADEYAPLPMTRAKSDAEILAVALIRAAGLEPPLLNVTHDGGEADLSWPLRRLIIELDGPDFHLFQSYDAIKQTRWERAGWTVRRLPTDDVYDRPERLFAAIEARVEPRR